MIIEVRFFGKENIDNIENQLDTAAETITYPLHEEFEDNPDPHDSPLSDVKENKDLFFQRNTSINGTLHYRLFNISFS